MWTQALSPLLFLLLAALLVHTTARASFADDHHPYDYPCKISETVASPYVSPQFEMSPAIRGCVSHEQSPLRRHVYVLNVIGTETPGGEENGRGARGARRTASAAGAGAREQQLDLYIKPVGGEGIHNDPMIFVLNSRHPTFWKIHSQSISNTTRNLFWLPDHSRLSKNSDINIRIKKFDVSTEMPLGADKLEAWVRRQPRTGGYMTMYAEVREARGFYVQVGEDLSAPRTCTIQRHLAADTVEARQLYPQVAGGCYQPRNEGIRGQNVHIIEVLGMESETLPKTIEIDITRQERESSQKSILLVLKSHGVVRWKIETQGMRGPLSIVLESNYAHDTSGSSMHPLNVIPELLEDKKKDELVDWVRNTWGPPVSYTSVHVANRFRLLVDGAAHLPPAGTDLEPPYLTPDPFDHPEKTQVALIQNKRIHCHEDDMIIVLGKQVLQVYGVQRGQLTLLDPSCTAGENQTHFFLTTSLSGCGTYKTENNGIIFYENAILVRGLNGGGSSVRSEDEDSMLADEGSGSGLMMADDTHFDDEDYIPAYEDTSDSRHAPATSSPIRVDFECEYPSGGGGSMGGAMVQPTLPPDLASSVNFNLKLFTDERFVIQYRNFPVVVNEEDPLYAQISIDGDDRLGVLVYSCWISEMPVQYWSKAPLSHILIDKGCARDLSFKFLGKASEHRETTTSQFKFDYKFNYPKASETNYIQCLLEPCLLQGNDPIPGANIGMCTTQKQYCVEELIPDKPDPLATKPFRQLVYVGELQRRAQSVTGGKKASPISTSVDPITAPTKKVCSRTVHMEGLDSGTVVGIAFAAFFIGVLLTAALWYIHTHTGYYRTARSNETSGESTPSSTAPITIHQVNVH